MVFFYYEQVIFINIIHILEYLNQPKVDHFVAVVSFGKDVKVLQHYSNDYKAILHILGRQTSCKLAIYILFFCNTRRIRT